IARQLDLPTREIGYAGLKDAHAVTRQLFTIPRVSEEQVMQLTGGDVTVIWAARHRNKLRMGHLSANRFAVKIRDVQATDVVKLKPIVDQLQQHGMPNYFGSQRFGRRGDNHLVGLALLREDAAAAMAQLLGNP